MTLTIWSLGTQIALLAKQTGAGLIVPHPAPFARVPSAAAARRPCGEAAGAGPV